MSAREWTEAHRREALRRTYELCATLVGEDRIGLAAELREVAWQIAQYERTWRADLGAAFDSARIDRELRRVDGLATGRLVRETVWRRDEDPGYGDLFSTKDLAGGGVGLRAVRVTRIRRAVSPQELAEIEATIGATEQDCIARDSGTPCGGTRHAADGRFTCSACGSSHVDTDYGVRRLIAALRAAEARAEKAEASAAGLRTAISTALAQLDRTRRRDLQRQPERPHQRRAARVGGVQVSTQEERDADHRRAWESANGETPPLRRCDDAVQAWQEVKEGLAREEALRASLRLVSTDAADVWRWQGDRHDHPESLTCPVVMSADTLRALLARAEEAEAVAAAERALRIAIEVGGDIDDDPKVVRACATLRALGVEP